MSDRSVERAIEAYLGADALRRLRSLRRRLWLRRTAQSAVLATAGVLVALALVQLAVRAFPLDWAGWIRAAAVAFGITAWIADAMRRRPSIVDAARRADEELGLRERLGTALEIAARGHDDPLEARQLADARARLGALDLGRAFRPQLARRPAAVAGVGLVMTLLLVAWPNPQDDILRQREAAREAAERVAERVEEVADEVAEELVENPDPRREELERELRELARQLREQGGDREATLARIGSVQEALSRMTDPEAAQRDSAVTQLARATSRAATGDDEANQQGDPEQAAQDLEDLAEDAGSMSRQEASARAAALRQAAQSGAAAHPEAARALAEAADALERAARTDAEEDRRAAEDALRRAGDAIRDAERDRQLQRDIASAQSALQDGARQVARAGQPTAGQPGASGQPAASGQPGGSPGDPGGNPGASPGSNPGSSPGSNPGGNPGSNPGGNPGSNPGSNPGGNPGSNPGSNPGAQPGGGGGTTVRRIPGGGLRTGGFDGPSQGNQGFDVDDRSDILVDFDRFGRPGDPDFIAGSGGNGGTDQSGSGTGAGFDNDSVVPYRSVFDLFRDYAQTALDRQQVPITLKDFVRDYFSRLEPAE